MDFAQQDSAVLRRIPLSSAEGSAVESGRRYNARSPEPAGTGACWPLGHKEEDVQTVPLGLPDRFEMAEELPSTPFERTLRAYDRVLQRQVLLKLPGAGA